MKSLVYNGPLKLALMDLPSKSKNDMTGTCKVRIAYAGICGSDMFIYQGTHPRAEAPLVLGHEASGWMESGHPGIEPGSPVAIFPLLSCGTCRPCTNGTPHVCSSLRLVGIDSDGCMTETATLPIETIVALPKGIDIRKASFIEPLAVGVHTVRRYGFVHGDTALIFGAGPIGLSVAHCLRAFGAPSVYIVEAMAYRRSLASSLGFKVLDPSEGPLAEQLKQQSGEPDIGLCFDCAAHPQVQNTILDLTRIRGTMVVVGSYKAPAPVDLLKIEFKELTIIGTRVYTRDDFRVAIDMIMDGRIDPDPLLTDFKPEDGPRLFNLLPGGVDIIKGIFNFGEWHEG